jgi:hypothetical protein
MTNSPSPGRRGGLGGEVSAKQLFYKENSLSYFLTNKTNVFQKKRRKNNR